MDHKIPVTRCECGEEMDASHESFGAAVAPKAEDVSICGGCAKLYLFNADLTQRVPNPEELAELKKSPALMLAQRALLKHLHGPDEILRGEDL